MLARQRRERADRVVARRGARNDDADRTREQEQVVSRLLDRAEDRPGEIDVSAGPAGSAALLVEIKYIVKDTHDERSIVYPFYLMGEEEY